MKIFKNGVAAFVILIIFLIIVPLSTVILDFMFVMNLAISFIILYIKEPLQFSIFLPFAGHHHAPAGAQYFLHPVYPEQRRVCR